MGKIKVRPMVTGEIKSSSSDLLLHLRPKGWGTRLISTSAGHTSLRH